MGLDYILETKISVKKQTDNIISCALSDEQVTRLVENVKQFLIAAQAEKGINIDGLVETREYLIKAVQDVVNSLNHIGEIRIVEYSYAAHVINVASISTVIAIKMGFKPEDIRKIALGALVHDVGKVKIPWQILEKPNKLTPKEFDLFKLHVPLGFKMAKDELNLDPIICRIILEHHEHYDGTGYPKKLSAPDMHSFSQLVCVANYYENLSTSKYDSKPKSCSDVVKDLLSMNTWFNPQYLYTLVHMIKLNYKYLSTNK